MAAPRPTATLGVVSRRCVTCVAVAFLVVAVFAGESAPARGAPAHSVFTVAGGVPANALDPSTGEPVRGPSPEGGLATGVVVTPSAVAALPGGGFLIAEDSRVRRVGADGIITAVAGGGARLGDGGPATRARVFPSDVAVLPDGGFLIADDSRVRRVSAGGMITTVAGTGEYPFSGDGGPATAAGVAPRDVATLPDGGFLIADTANERIRRVGADGTITTVAGGRSYLDVNSYAREGGPAVGVFVGYPRSVAALPDGGFVFIEGDRVRQVDADGTLTTVAGTHEGFSGDGGPATAARLRDPQDVVALPAGGLLIADTGNGRIRQVSPDGTITTVAGTRATPDGSWADWSPYTRHDGGPATAAKLAPRGLAVLPGGGFLVAEEDRVRLVAGPSTRQIGLALGDPERDRALGARYMTHLSLSRPGRVRIELLRGRRVAARRTVTVARRGWMRVRVEGRVRAGIHTVRAIASTRGTGTTIQTRLVALGGVLPDRWAIQIVDGDDDTRVVTSGLRFPGEERRVTAPTAVAADEPENVIARRTRLCRRFASSRVDCEAQEAADEGAPYSCAWLDQIVLRRNGQIYRRSYRCPTRQAPSLFKLRPRTWLDRDYTNIDLRVLK